MSDFNINHITDKQGQQGTVLAGVSTNNSTGAMRIPSGGTVHRGGKRKRNHCGGYPITNTLNFIPIAFTGRCTRFW